MLNDFVEKVRGFIMKPVETFQKVKGGSLGDAFVYYIILLVINAVLSAIVLAAGLSAMSIYQSIPGFNGAFPLVMFFMVLVGGIIGIFVGGAWLHIFVWALGGKKGYVQTVKSVMYGSTPSLLLGWIPIIGFIGAIWTIILDIFGIEDPGDVGWEGCCSGRNCRRYPYRYRHGSRDSCLYGCYGRSRRCRGLLILFLIPVPGDGRRNIRYSGVSG